MKVASIQAEVAFRGPEANAQKAIERLSDLAKQQVDLAVFPECYLTGYCVETTEHAASLAIDRTHPAIRSLREVAEATNVAIAFGFAESADGHLYNTAALFVPGEEDRFYRKTHLPELGFDNFTTPGDQIEIFDTKLGKIGIIICFDMRFPEPARVLALAGADVILIPTNWPEGAQVSAETICVARAAESRVWVVTCNRVGNEEGFHFIGRSKIISPVGKVVASAGETAGILIHDLDLAEARLKRTITIPGKYETDVIAPRRPDLYGSLSANSTSRST